MMRGALNRDLLNSRSAGRCANHSASIRRFEASMFNIPLHQEIAQPARAMTGELRVKDRIAPIVVAGVGRCAPYLPARQSGAGLDRSAIAQQKVRDAAVP